MAKAPPSQKLPVMYLMDSILKNVGGEYLKAFAPNLVETFLSVFEKVDTNTRKSLFLLRSTWDRIFPLEKLHALDVRVRSLDPAWPVKPLPPDGNASGPPVSPQRAAPSPEESTAPTSAMAGASVPPALAEIPKPLTQEQLLRQQVLEKEKQLLDLRQKILELEQAQAQLVNVLGVCSELPSKMIPAYDLGTVQTEEMTSAESERQGGKQRRASARKGPAEAQPPATHSPQGLERRALKRRLRSLSPISSSPKLRKIHQIGPKQSQLEEDTQAARGGRNSHQSNVKAEVQDQRAVNRAREGSLQGTASQHPAKASPDAKECAENWNGAKLGKRWKPGWEENPNSQRGEEHQALAKCPHQRHQETWPAAGRILSPRAPRQQHCLGLMFERPPGALPLSRPDNRLGQLPVNELFAKLLSAGILHLPDPAPTSAQGNEPSAQPAAEGKATEQKEDVPDLTDFQVKELRQRYSSAINALHTGIQCGSCGVRLATSQDYAKHLDWHYGQNRRQRAAGRAAAHRQWYCSSAEWIEFAEAADLEKPAKSQIFERPHEAMLKAREGAKKEEIQSVPAGPAGADESCEICQEQFEQYWDDEEEEWRLRNAIRVDAKIYHPSCYKD
ncbi:pre-mRNA cleavage complex 2 protein Pcf11-like [Indicator indicator]|uniref:pre-mRNA cleavage complex 2 protein Pcf11-like n=1 Tax=Indicator indicator TaxID=1002788 RepID=UPI0023E02869|nr:pre-mRNA cleavage complex 2 protein Pcf11-like [Indicator indicator]